VKKILLPIALGLLAPIVYILGAEPFEVPGRNSLKEILAGSLALAIYFAACYTLIVRKAGAEPRVSRPTLIGMLGSLVATSLLVTLQGGRAWLYSALPMLIGGGVGSVVGALLAARGARKVAPAPGVR
jgi:hypothetical protein